MSQWELLLSSVQVDSCRQCSRAGTVRSCLMGVVLASHSRAREGIVTDLQYCLLESPMSSYQASSLVSFAVWSGTKLTCSGTHHANPVRRQGSDSNHVPCPRVRCKGASKRQHHVRSHVDRCSVSAGAFLSSPVSSISRTNDRPDDTTRKRQQSRKESRKPN
jgi:hypothetical protein